MSAKENTARAVINQPKSSSDRLHDSLKLHELEAHMLTDLEFAVRFARLAYEHSDMFDYQGFVLSVEKFLNHARALSGRLKELRRCKGMTDDVDVRKKS